MNNEEQLKCKNYEEDFNLVGFFSLLYIIATRLEQAKKQTKATKKIG